jgi:cytochrome P450
VVNHVFSGRSRADLERRARAIATNLIDRLAEHGRAEFVSQFGFPLPLRVILNLLGARRRRTSSSSKAGQMTGSHWCWPP